MRKLFLLLPIPVSGMGQAKNVVSSFRLFAKPEKNAELQKNLTARAQKYHRGDWKWRVFETQAGPDACGTEYARIVESRCAEYFFTAPT